MMPLLLRYRTAVFRSVFILLLLVDTVLLLAQADDLYFRENARGLAIPPWQALEANPLLDSAVGGYSFFLTSEQHRLAINTQMEYAFLLYLHQRAGVRNLIVEHSISYGILLNRYLETGDERLLKRIIEDIPICPESELAMFQSLYRYNAALPQEERIRVTGIDVEHSPELSLQCLNMLKPKSAPPQGIAKYMDGITHLHRSLYLNEKEVQRFFKKLKADIPLHPKLYHAYWGRDFDLFDLIVDNAVMGSKLTILNSVLSQKLWRKREEQMYKNFVSLHPWMKAGNYFGQFGALHGYLTTPHKWKFPTLARRLNTNKDSPALGKVLSISRWFREPGFDYERMGDAELLDQFVWHSENRMDDFIILLKLDGEGNPFPALSHNFQYLLVLDPALDKEPCD